MTYIGRHFAHANHCEAPELLADEGNPNLEGTSFPAQLLALRRGHWRIENALHRQKDALFREDAPQVHLSSDPAVLSLLRDAAITLLHLAGHRDLAARTRALSQFPHQARKTLPVVGRQQGDRLRSGRLW